MTILIVFNRRFWHTAIHYYTLRANRYLVGLPVFKTGVGFLTASVGFDSHSLSPFICLKLS